MEREKKSKPKGLRLKSTKKLKTMTQRQTSKHVLMELCKNAGRALIKKSNGSTDHTQNCPMCGITHEERLERGSPLMERSHVGVDFQPMLTLAVEQVFMTHLCDELTNGEILPKVMSILHDLHNTAVKNQSCAIQPSCKWCNWYLGKCTVQQVDLLKNNPQAWRKHVLALNMKRRKNTCSQPTITSMLQSQDSSDEESSDSNSDTGDLGRLEIKQENESSDEESSLKRTRGSVDTDSGESRQESKRQRRVNPRPDYRNNGANLANAKRPKKTNSNERKHLLRWNNLFASWLEKCCVVCGDGQQNEDMRYKQAKSSWHKFCDERCLDCPPYKHFMELLEKTGHKVTKHGKSRAHDTFQVTSLQFNQDNVEVREIQDSFSRKFFEFVKNK